ncbi:hypothetical protein BDP27DRAFT_1429513 [Rhodocollybia butyracea]|uniref:F-box domain-containing protein n=1 Tax=Rhodocollybia butyracea TaxID=206335 RepID=A0A9P5PCH3_9AGAR|nr:hypothetical protein BDP27DRAFT_1429513 [Rhodocollybia butyracea]
MSRTLIDQTRIDLQTFSENTTHSQILRVLELQESLLAPIRTVPSNMLSQILRVLELQESLLAPIRTVPSNMLTTIFQLVIEASDEPDITYSTRVCSWWRHEAVSYATFWTKIKDSLRTTKMTAFLTECILRSGVSAPLSIGIVLVNPDVHPSVITILVAQAHRWRQATFKLSFVSSQYIDSLFPFEPSSTHFPLLEDLSVDSRRSFSNRILDCRPLQKLELGELEESYADVIGSRNLKVLKVGYYWGVSLARLLHQCPCLESLTLQCFKFTQKPDKQITCRSSLLALDIGGDLDNDEKIEYGAWNVFHSPTAYEADTSASELKEILKRSECALQYVNLILYVEEYDFLSAIALEMVEGFFADLPVKDEHPMWFPYCNVRWMWPHPALQFKMVLSAAANVPALQCGICHSLAFEKLLN